MRRKAKKKLAVRKLAVRRLAVRRLAVHKRKTKRKPEKDVTQRGTEFHHLMEGDSGMAAPSARGSEAP